MSHHAETWRTRLSLNQAGAGLPTIVVGVDGSPTSWYALAWAAGEALRTHSRLLAVYVMPYTDPAAALGVPYDYAGSEKCRQAFAGELETEATHRARDLGVPVGFVSEYGDPSSTLADIARTVDAHLVVVGRSAKMWHRLTGSLGHRLTCRKDAPVVVVVP